MDSKLIVAACLTSLLIAGVLTLSEDLAGLRYEDIQDDPDREIFYMIQSFLIKWATIFAVETGISISVIQKPINNDKGNPLTSSIALFYRMSG